MASSKLTDVGKSSADEEDYEEANIEIKVNSKEELKKLLKDDLIKIATDLGFRDPKKLSKQTLFEEISEHLFPSLEESSNVMQVGKSVVSSEMLELEKLKIQMELERMKSAERDKEREREKEREEFELKKEREREEYELKKERERADLELRRERERADLEMRKLQFQVDNPTLSSSSINPSTNSSNNNFRIDIAAKMLPALKESNIEEFFTAFERVAQIQKWNKTDWVSIIQTQFSGKILKIFNELPFVDAMNYDKVKEAMSRAFQLTSHAYRKRFRDMSKNEQQTYSDFVFHLSMAYTKWMKSIQALDNVERMTQAIVIEQLLNKLPSELALYVTDLKLERVSDIAASLDTYVAIRGSVSSTMNPASTKSEPVNANYDYNRQNYSNNQNNYNNHKSGKYNNKYKPRRSRSAEASSLSNSGQTAKDNDLRCFKCGHKGHFARNCRTKRENYRHYNNDNTSSTQGDRRPPPSNKDNSSTKPKEFAKSQNGNNVNVIQESETIQSATNCSDVESSSHSKISFDSVDSVHLSSVISPCEVNESVHPLFKPYCQNGFVVDNIGNKYPICSLRDTAALQSLLRTSSIPRSCYKQLNEVRLIKGIGDQEVEIQMIEFNLELPNLSGRVRAGLVDSLPIGIDFLLANDVYCKFCDITSDDSVAVVTRSMSKSSSSSDHTIINEQRDLSISNLFDPSDTVTQPNVIAENRIQNDYNDSNNQIDVENDSVESLNTLNVTDLNISRERLIQLQNQDMKLNRLYSQVLSKPYPNAKDYYYDEEGLLMHSHYDKKRKVRLNRIVIPNVLVPRVLSLAHDITLAGHLGFKKTYQRLESHFYWVKFYRSIKAYIRSCHICQRLDKKHMKRKAPLQPLPIVDEPFKRLIMDTVGPLHTCPKSGNRFILTLIDQSSHYPIAIPLKDHKASTVCTALMEVFSNFGFPIEIQSDKGTDFTSDIAKHFFKMFNIAHFKSTAMHPESQGQLERFHRCLKDMLRSIQDEFEGNWDEALPYVLFAYRECPVETIGFSPFELIYTYPVRGPLSILKDCWSSKHKSNRPHVVKFMLDVSKKIRLSKSLASEYAKRFRAKEKTWYDRDARDRTFNVGDLVLALLPKAGEPLDIAWKGPFKVLERVSDLNYLISSNSKRNPSRLCHVNMLKSYTERHDVLTNVEVLDKDNEEDVLFDKLPSLAKTNKEQTPQFNMSHLDKVKQKELSEILDKFSDIFSDKPGRTHLIEHVIKLKPGIKPIRQHPYRANPIKSSIIKREVDEMLEMGLIRESKSSWASPIILVDKPDGTIRFVIDYRKVNAVSDIDPFPLPRVDDLVERVGSAKFITKIDISKAFWQIPLDKDSQAVSSFITPFGLYEFTVMPFGLSSAGSTFQRLMQKVLEGLQLFAWAYLDDIIIYSNSWQEHLKHIESVLERIRDAGLTIKKAKCEFANAIVTYLGHVVGNNQICPTRAKVQSILDFPKPSDKKQVRQFLGVVGYYRRYIPHLAHIAAPLTDLMKKGRSFIWDSKADEAFVQIKSLLATGPILKPPDFNKPFQIAVDASDLAVGAVLGQVEGEIFHPVCYLSRRLNIHQSRYSTIEKECFALLTAVRAFSVYFSGEPVIVYTDHNPLQYLFRMANHNKKLLRWLLEVQQYNLEIKYKPGKQNILPDLLSRPSVIQN